MVKAATKRVTEIGGEVPSDGAESGVQFQIPYRVLVSIEGVCPILFHAWNVESVESKSKAKKGSAEKKSDDVESYVYRNEKGEICIPGEYLRGAIINAAKFTHDPRSPRKSAADLYKAGIVSLTPLASLGAKNWDFMDKRRVQIQRNAITRSRPAMKEGWQCYLHLAGSASGIHRSANAQRHGSVGWSVDRRGRFQTVLWAVHRDPIQSVGRLILRLGRAWPVPPRRAEVGQGAVRAERPVWLDLSPATVGCVRGKVR